MNKTNNLLKATLIASSLLCASQTVAQDLKTINEVTPFIENAEQQLLDVEVKFARGHYIWDTYKTRDTGRLLGEVFLNRNDTYVNLAAAASKLSSDNLNEVEQRKLLLLKSAETWNTPVDKTKRVEKRALQRKIMQLATNKGSCDQEGNCLSILDINGLMEESKSLDELRDLWHRGHELAQPILPHYQELSAIIDGNAKSLGFSDSFDMWSTQYQVKSLNLSYEMERVWQQVEPLYSSLKCHVQDKLAETYDEIETSSNQAIPAHLLGNLSARDFTKLAGVMKPVKNLVDKTIPLTEKIQKQQLDALAIVKQAEKFYTSMGFEALPESFYQFSQFIKPRDREVECYANGWVMDYKDDIRLRMCIEPSANDFVEVHKQLAYLLDARAHNSQPFLFNQQPNSAFNVAIKEAMALSITPSYLETAKLSIKDNTELNDLMTFALEKVSALPFDLALAHWQESVFSGDKSVNDNDYWWSLRKKYQGIAPPTVRNNNHFDAGLQADVTSFKPAGVTNFLATILQFQYHESLCKVAGNNKPLHQCSIYNSTKVGDTLRSTFAMGNSRPWPEVLAKLSGNHQLDGSSLVSYFAPLQAYLDEQNKGLSCAS